MVPIQLAQLPPITEMGLGTIRHANGRPEISRRVIVVFGLERMEIKRKGVAVGIE